MPVTATANTYATWDNGTNTYATLEAAPTYGVLEGARLTITRTLPSSGTLGTSRAVALSLGGTLGASGTLPKQLTFRRAFAGALLSAGTVLLGKIFTRSLAGSLTASGVVSRVRQRLLAVAGELVPSGVFSFRQLQRVYIVLDGRLWPIGEVHFEVRRSPWPPFTPDIRPGAPALVSSSTTAAPLLTLISVAHPGAPPLTTTVPVSAPPLTLATKPKWPPFHTDAEPR